MQFLPELSDSSFPPPAAFRAIALFTLLHFVHVLLHFVHVRQEI
jgi:hypothetical protein